MAVNEGTRRIVGGVDTHKDLHVAAVVDEQDRVIGTRSFATTRQGYRQMLAWMRAFGDLQRIGVEFDWQLWRRPSPFHAASRDCGSRGHNPGQAGSPQTRQERRSRCPERGPCRLCRPADRDAAKPGRHDRIPTGSHGLPEDRSERQARRPADADQPTDQFQFTFTPKHGSWLNLVEGFFSKLARSVLRHIRVASKQELKDRIMAAIDHFNRDPVVHTWSYKLDQAA